MPTMKTDLGEGVGTVFALLMLSYLILPLVIVCVCIAFDLFGMAYGVEPFGVWFCRVMTGIMGWGAISIVREIFGSKETHQ